MTYRTAGSRARRGMSAATVVALAAAALAAGLAFAAHAGKLDRSFGRHGKTLLKDLTGYAESVQVGHHGRIVAAGFSGNRFASGAEIAVARLLPDGRIDHSFSHDGIKKTHFGNLSRANDVAVAPGGGIVVVGETCIAKQDCEAAIVRYTRDGHLDKSFSSDGRKSINFEHGPGVDSANAVGIDSKGRAVIAGSGCLNGVPSCDVVITRLNHNGSIDRDYTSGAQAVYLNFNAGPQPCPDSGGAASMALDHYGKPVAVGTCDGHDIGLVRLRTGGSVDRSFGDHGAVRVDLGFFDGAEDVGLDSHARIVVSGAIKHQGFAVARFQRDGKLDRGFGSGGAATSGPGGPGNELAIDSHNRIVVAGGPITFRFARFASDGDPDRSFGHDGSMSMGRQWGYGYGLGVATDGRDRIVASGFKKRRFLLLRLQG